MRSIPLPLLTLVGIFSGCSRAPSSPQPGPAAQVSSLLAPQGWSQAVRAAGGAKIQLVTTFRIAAPDADAQRSTVTTTTTLTLDRQGNYHFEESNDHGGGRKVTLFGRELTVSLAPENKAIRRPAQAGEPQRLLEEALGGPAAVLQLVQRFAAITATDSGFAIKLSPTPAPAIPAAPLTGPARTLGAYRESLVALQLEGNIARSASAPLPTTIALTAGFSFERNGARFQGLAQTKGTVTEIGTVAAIAAAPGETLTYRQRTILEERALLDGLPSEGRAPLSTRPGAAAIPANNRRPRP